MDIGDILRAIVNCDSYTYIHVTIFADGKWVDHIKMRGRILLFKSILQFELYESYVINLADGDWVYENA